MDFSFKRIFPFVCCAILTLIILKLHITDNIDSMLNENNTRISNGFLTSQVKYHGDLPAFARRPLTTFLINKTSSLFGVRIGDAFIYVNFFLLWLSGCLLYVLSKKLNASNIAALINTLVYYSSFSIIFLFFPPIFSYDEPLQYSLIFAALYSLFSKRIGMYIVLLTLAAISKEASIFLIPGLFYFVSKEKGQPFISLSAIKKHFYIGVPVILYAIYVGVFIWQSKMVDVSKAEMHSRLFCLSENFEDAKSAMESISSIILILLWPLYLIAIYWKKIDSYHKKIFIGFLITVAINSPIITLFTLARESRLYALPLVLFWPIFYQVFWKHLQPVASFNRIKNCFSNFFYLGSFLVCTLINLSFCYYCFYALGLGENNYFTIYLFVTIAAIYTHFLLWHHLTFKVTSEENRLQK